MAAYSNTKTIRTKPSALPAMRHRILTGSLVVILLFSTANPLPAVVQKMFHKPFPGNTVVKRMAVFGNVLYAVAGGYDTSAGKYRMRVYRLDSAVCKIWDDVTPPWKTVPSISFVDMIVFGAYLYLHTDKGLYRTPDGQSWSCHPIMAGGAAIPNDNCNGEMIIYKNKLYVVAGDGIFRTSNAQSWSQFASPNTNSTDFWRFAVFKNNLYLGCGLDNINGIQVWRTDGTSSWNKFADVTQFVPPGHINAMEVFNNELYIGSYEGGAKIFRTNGQPGDWHVSYSFPGGGGCGSLEVHNGALYAGVYDRWYPFPGQAILFRTYNGTDWKAVPGAVGGAQTHGIWSLKSLYNRIFGGTEDKLNGGEIYQIGAGFICAIKLLFKDYHWSVWTWIWRFKDDLKYLLQSAEETGKSWSDTVLQDFGTALSNLSVSDEKQGLKEEALALYETICAQMDAAIEKAWDASTIEDPQDRIPIVETALAELDNAVWGLHDLGEMLSAIIGALEPATFYSGFNPDESVWELTGDVYIAGPSGAGNAAASVNTLPPSSENEWELHATGEGRAVARMDPLFDPLVWNMSVLVSHAWCDADLGRLGGKRFILRVFPSHIQILKHRPDNPRVIAEVEIPPTANPWKFIQIEKILSDFKIAWNGKEVFSVRLPEGFELEFQPKFTFPPDAEVMVYLDDIMATHVGH